MTFNLEKILKNVVGDPPLYLHEPRFEKSDHVYVKECIDTGWVSYAGGFVKKFEDQLSSFTKMNHVIATVNGTVSLQIALQLVGVMPEDEVLVPSLTFVASANAVIHAGGIPHFIDVHPDDFGIDPMKLENYLHDISYFDDQGNCRNKKTKRIIRAILPVHILGHPCAIQDILKVAHKYNLKVVEDAAEGLGSLIEDQHVGHFGDVAVLSFNGNKVLTTGGGGSILTHDENIAKRALHMTTTAKKNHVYEFFHDEVAYNFRLPNLNAALGCSQMDRIHSILQKKRTLAARYEDAFINEEGVFFHKEPENTKSNYWLNSIKIPNISIEDRNTILQSCIDKGFYCRPLWIPMHLLPMFKECPRMLDLSTTEKLQREVICLPSSIFLASHV